MKPNSKPGLTLIELLTILAIIFILATILIPTHSGHRAQAWKALDASNLRQIGQAALIYANDNGGQLPGLSLNEVGEIVENGTTPNLHAIAAALAVGLSENGGLINDATLWVSWEDRHPGVNRDNLHRVINSRSSRTLAPEFASSALSFQFVAGLDVKMPSTTPIAFTRGLQPDGAWSQDKSLSVYGDDGGHIVFLGGNVQFFRNVHQDGGSLKDVNGEVSANILETIDSSARIFSYPATATGAVDGMPGIAQP